VEYNAIAWVSEIQPCVRVLSSIARPSLARRVTSALNLACQGGQVLGAGLNRSELCCSLILQGFCRGVSPQGVSAAH
jgi:hypothetical protein